MSQAASRLTALLVAVALPVPLPAIPGIEQIGETIVTETGDLTDDWPVNDPPQPIVARRAPPDRDRAYDTHIEAAFFVNGAMLKGSMSFEELDQKIRSLLKK